MSNFHTANGRQHATHGKHDVCLLHVSELKIYLTVGIWQVNDSEVGDNFDLITNN